MYIYRNVALHCQSSIGSPWSNMSSSDEDDNNPRRHPYYLRNRNIDFIQYNIDHVGENSARSPPAQRSLPHYFRQQKKVSPEVAGPSNVTLPGRTSTPDSDYNLDLSSGSYDASPIVSDSDDMATAQAVDPSLKEAAGVPAASGDSINPGFSYIKRPIDQKIHYQSYTNVCMAETWGYAYHVIKEADQAYGQLFTPLACIPANQLSTYMSRAEFERLPAGSTAVSCKIKVTPKGFRTSFATQQTGSTYSNSNHTIFGISAIGLNKDQFGKNVEIDDRTPTKPMIVTAVKECKSTSYENIAWGLNLTNPNQRTKFFEELPMCIGVHRSLPYYWNAHIYAPSTNNNVHTGWPYLRENITEWDFAGHVNKPIMQYSYKFNHGLLKNRATYYPRPDYGTVEANKTHAFAGNVFNCFETVEVDNDGQIIAGGTHAQQKKDIPVFDYESNIEKPFLGHFTKSDKTNQVQPLPYIGINPIPANSPGSANDFTNVQAVWLIETEIIVAVYNQTEFAGSQKLHPWKGRHCGTVIHSGAEVLNFGNTTGRYVVPIPPAPTPGPTPSILNEVKNLETSYKTAVHSVGTFEQQLKLNTNGVNTMRRELYDLREAMEKQKNNNRESSGEDMSVQKVPIPQKTGATIKNPQVTHTTQKLKKAPIKRHTSTDEVIEHEEKMHKDHIRDRKRHAEYASAPLLKKIGMTIEDIFELGGTVPEELKNNETKDIVDLESTNDELRYIHMMEKIRASEKPYYNEVTKDLKL